MTLTLLVLVLGFIGVCIIVPIALWLRSKFSPKFDILPQRKLNTLSTLATILSFLYQLSFMFVYLSDHLANFSNPWGDIYWVSAGLSGIIFGFIGVNCPRLISVISILQIILGFGLLGLLVLAIGITSM
ncbi:hypothetical protein [Paenibacillus roseipurpureus]|uniref:Uncharacterized protein n=1 Tax=Paenibacillus roseopurpureus TaxID=2918901 RepID=A0AA96LUR2_9BACL|nr:hypothetical protein [Paenibacillus sp. MBLB1832]WNR46856.1 hypothetical protein MJB10_12440 [Paenibacillus sp. MBLB1832]